MDHPISELSECIFDYLVSQADIPKSFTQIYDDISGPSGHRCSELNNIYNKNLYKNRFMADCYTLDIIYKNIYKIFKYDIPYLIFSTKSKQDVFNQFNVQFLNNHQTSTNNYNSHLVNNQSDTYYNSSELDGIIDYLLEHNNESSTYFSNLLFNQDQSILQYIIRTNKIDKLRKLMDLYDIDLTHQSNGKTLIDVASDNNNVNLLRELLDYQYNKKVTELSMTVSDIKKTNTRLLNNNMVLTLKNNRLESRLNKSNQTFNFYNKGFYTILLFNVFIMCILFYQLLY